MFITKEEIVKREKFHEKKKKLHIRDSIKEREGTREGTATRSKRKKLEVLLKLIEGDCSFSFWHCLFILT